MTGKELFEKYRGMEFKSGYHKGVVCGYRKDNTPCLLIAVTDFKSNDANYYKDNYEIVEHTNNDLGYWPIGKELVIDNNTQLKTQVKPNIRPAKTLISVGSIESVKMYYANEDAKPYLEIRTKSGDVHKIEHEDNTSLIEHYNSIAKDVERFVVLY